MAQSETKEKLFDAIHTAVVDVEKNGQINVLQKAAALERLSLAYRYVAGGQQPGGVHVEK